MTSSEILIVVFTAVIATTGVIGSLIFNSQLSVMRGQLDQMKAGSKTAEDTLIAAQDAAKAAKASADVAKSALIDVQRAFVFPIDINRSRAIDFSMGRTSGWNFNAFWKNSGTTQAKNLYIRTSGRTFPQQLSEDYPFPESFYANESVIGPQGTLLGGTMGVALSTLEEVKAGKLFLYLWGSVEYDDVFAGTPRHRTEYCFQVLVVGDLTTDTGNVFVMSACARHNRSYDIDRSKQRDEYNGPETEHIGPALVGTKLSLPPNPL